MMLLFVNYMLMSLLVYTIYLGTGSVVLVVLKKRTGYGDAEHTALLYWPVILLDEFKRNGK